MLLALTAVVNIATAQTESKATPEVEIKEIIATHQTAMATFMEKVRALPREKQSEFYQAEYPKPDETLAALNKFVDADPKAPAVLDALTWIAQNTRGSGLDADDYANLEENHLNHEKVGSIIMALAYSQKAEALDFLTTASKKSTVANVRGTALYALSVGMKRDKTKAAEHEALTQKIISEYPDLTIGNRKIAKSIKAEKEAAVKFAIGNPAPEIIGKDVDGAEMKLSDYKGQVVVLDFWGDW